MAKARIIHINRYEIATGRLAKMSRQTNPNARQLEIWEDRQERYKEIADKNIVLGGIHRIRYQFFEHDPFPLALTFSLDRRDIKAVPAINLHYLNPAHMQILLKIIQNRNMPRIKRGLAPIVLYDLIKDLPLPYMAYRLYKYNGIYPLEYIPLSEWDTIHRTEKNRWQGRLY